jgi:hypothetical protein
MIQGVFVARPVMVAVMPAEARRGAVGQEAEGVRCVAQVLSMATSFSSWRGLLM